MKSTLTLFVLSQGLPPKHRKRHSTGTSISLQNPSLFFSPCYQNFLKKKKKKIYIYIYIFMFLLISLGSLTLKANADSKNVAYSCLKVFTVPTSEGLSNCLEDLDFRDPPQEVCGSLASSHPRCLGSRKRAKGPRHTLLA